MADFYPNAATPPEADDVSRTRAYAREHHLNELFVHFMQLLLYYRPENPRQFLVQEIRKIREEKVASSLFTEKDLETMFDLIDVTRQRTITATQLRNACRNLSTSTGSPAGGPVSGGTGTSTGAQQQDEMMRYSAEEAMLDDAIANATDEKGLVSLENFKKVLSMLLVTRNVWSA